MSATIKLYPPEQEVAFIPDPSQATQELNPNYSQIWLLRMILANIAGSAGSLESIAKSSGGPGEYKTIAASQTNSQLGATGAIGDYFMGILVVPASTSPGAVTIKDGSDSAITVFAGGADSITNLVPFYIPLEMKARGAGWKVTTGANLSVIAEGDFT